MSFIEKPIIIIGMHRSGTTMITKMLEEAGVFFGSKKQVDNESIFFLDINNWLLKSASSTWDNPENFKYLLDSSEASQLSVDYIDCLLNSPHAISYLGLKNYLKYKSIKKIDFLWGWKDPRNSLTLDVWMKIFPNAKIIHVYRNGIDVASSLHKRATSELASFKAEHVKRKNFGLYKFKKRNQGFTRSVSSLDLQRAFKLWETYTKESLLQEQKYPTNFYSVKYEDFLSDSTQLFQKLLQFCEVDISKSRVEEICTSVRSNRKFAYKTDSELQAFYMENDTNDLMKLLDYS